MKFRLACLEQTSSTSKRRPAASAVDDDDSEQGSGEVCIEEEVFEMDWNQYVKSHSAATGSFSLSVSNGKHLRRSEPEVVCSSDASGSVSSRLAMMSAFDVLTITSFSDAYARLRRRCDEEAKWAAMAAVEELEMERVTSSAADRAHSRSPTDGSMPSDDVTYKQPEVELSATRKNERS
jgi:hypothetical protein